MYNRWAFEENLLSLDLLGDNSDVNVKDLRQAAATQFTELIEGVEPVIHQTIHGYYSAIFVFIRAGAGGGRLVRLQIGEIEADCSGSKPARYRPVFFSGAEGFAKAGDLNFTSRGKLKKRMFAIVKREQIMIDLRRFGHYSGENLG